MSSSIWLYIIFAAAILALAVVAVVQRINQRRLLDKLDSLLNSAIDGSFAENTFDESQYSALEAKLGKYLQASAVSAKNLAGEKDKIKELIGDISHQTKTPIANILLYSQLLEEMELPEGSSRCVSAISSQAEKLSFLIGALVKTSRLETGVLTLNPAVNSVDEIIKNVICQSMPKAEGKGIALEAGDAHIEAVFDPKWTAEALYNVVDNAVKYTSQGGRVRVTAAEYEMFCRIDVADNGAGISEDDQTKIFARFYRSPEAAQNEGVGIGLYLTREILTGQGGYIKVSSQKGKGSVFSLYLPKQI